MRGQKLSKIHFLILLSLLGFISPLQSQEYKFRTLGVEDGLSRITVSDICQDEKSRIWIATLDGLNCFDAIISKSLIIFMTIPSVMVIYMSPRWWRTARGVFFS